MMFKERLGPPQKDGSLESAARLPLILNLTGWEGLGTTQRRGKLLLVLPDWRLGPLVLSAAN